MKWSDIGGQIAKWAPAVGAAVTGNIPGAIAGVASALGVDAEPDAVGEALKKDPDAAVKLRELEVQLKKAEITADTDQFLASQKTIQTEAEHGTAYVKETRPKLARLSFYVGSAYAIGMTAASLFIEGAPGPEAALIGTLFGPCGFYMTMRTVDAFSPKGKTA